MAKAKADIIAEKAKISPETCEGAHCSTEAPSKPDDVTDNLETSIEKKSEEENPVIDETCMNEASCQTEEEQPDISDQGDELEWLLGDS